MFRKEDRHETVEICRKKTGFSDNHADWRGINSIYIDKNGTRGPRCGEPESEKSE